MRTEYTRFEAELLRDAEIRQAYEALEPKYELIRALIRRRTKLKMSQTQLARKVGTRQPAISRLESGDCNTTLDTLYRVAGALGLSIHVVETPPGGSRGSNRSLAAKVGIAR